jgi:transcriptional regulator with XRE-family HTH domain
MANDTFLVEMGARIASRRKELHMTQEQLADKIGVSLQTISCIELGKKAVRPENLANLCLQLDISADFILYGKRSKQQMTDTVEKLSSLPPEAYRTVQSVIDLLHGKNK